ncbi:hypothetical protein GGI25_006469, partial [Coemansia spiralis]
CHPIVLPMLIDPTTRYLAMNVADGFRKRTSAIRHAHAAIITRKTRKQAQEIVVTTTIGANIVNLATTAVVTDISNDTVNDTVTTAIAAKIVAKVDAAFTSSAATDTASTDDIATNIVATANTAVSSTTAVAAIASVKVSIPLLPIPPWMGSARARPA